MDSINISMNIFKRFMRESSSILYLLVFPVLAAILAITMTREPIVKVGMVETGLSSEVISYIEDSPKYDLVRIEEENIEALLNNKDINYAIMAKNEDNIYEGVKLYSLTSDQGLMELNGIIEGVLKGDISIGNYENPINEGRMVIGFSTMFILMFMGAITGNLLEDRKSKTLMRIYSTPQGRIKISFGYLTAFLILGILQVIAYIVLTKYIMKIDYNISIVNLFVIITLFLITATGISIGLAGFVREPQKYSVLNTFITVPTCLLGGSFFPVSFMPDSMKVLSNFIPQKWFMEVYDKLSEGASLIESIGSLGILLMFGVVFFTLGIRTIHPSLEEL